MSARDDLLQAVCTGHWDLFDSMQPADHAEARDLCRTCPALNACHQLVAEIRSSNCWGPRICGTWAGRLYRHGRPHQTTDDELTTARRRREALAEFVAHDERKHA